MIDANMMCILMMQQQSMQMQNWQNTVMQLSQMPDAYRKYQLYNSLDTYYNFSPKPKREELTPLPIYYQLNVPDKLMITRETSSIYGEKQTKFVLNEISKHNFVLRCFVSKNAKGIKDKIYSQLDDILQHIYNDTEYIVAYVNKDSMPIDEILLDYGFKKITEHGDDDTFLLK